MKIGWQSLLGFPALALAGIAAAASVAVLARHQWSARARPVAAQADTQQRAVGQDPALVVALPDLNVGISRNETAPLGQGTAADRGVGARDTGALSPSGSDRGAAPPAVAAGDSAGRGGGAAGAAPGIVRGAPLRIEGKPRSVQVALVPVPVSLPRDTAVVFEIVPSGVAPILGALRGLLGAGPARLRAVVVTASVPAHARAGRYHIAEVSFSVGGVPRAQVPIELEVAQIRGASVKFAQQLFAARLGDRLRVGYSLVNTGNGPDSLAVTVEAPRGWRATAAPARQVLSPGEAAEGVVALSIPRASSTGASRLRLILSGLGGERARADAVVEVVETQAASTQYGPRLTLGVATVVGDTGSEPPVVGLELYGPVAPQLTVRGRLVQAAGSGEVDPRGLARVGYFVGAPYLSLAAPTWQLTAGTTGRSFSEITGLDLWGRGGSFAWDGSRWTVAALASRPSASGTSSDGGRLLGARVGRHLKAGWVGATATDLADRQSGDRRLTALGLAAVSPPVLGATLSAELAERWHGAGRGLGWLAEVSRRRSWEDLRLRYAFAPGGSAAFARARTQVSATGTRRLRRGLWLAGGYWLADDANAVLSRLHSSGWSLAPQLALDDRTTVELEARGTSFDADGGAGAFGSAETVVRLGVTARRGPLYASASAEAGRVARSATPLGGAAADAAAGRQAVRGLFGWTTDRGVLEANASLDRNGAGVGLLPRQYVVGLRANRVAVLPGRAGPLVTVELQHYGWFGSRADAAVARAGVQVPVVAGVVLTVDAERNGFVRGPGNRIPWIAAIKLERAVGLPLGRLRAAARGVVYQDLNVNGTRDPGEPGVAGALVRRAGESVVTGRDGSFQFFAPSEAQPELDEPSLPFGVVVSPVATTRPTPEGRFDIAVIPTAAVEVRLVRTAGEDGRLPRVALTAAIVLARDERGNAWTARTDSAGLSIFQALPPGRYRLELDLGGLSEPLRPRGDLPGFTVAPGQPVPGLTIPVYSRPIRLRNGRSPDRP